MDGTQRRSLPIIGLNPDMNDKRLVLSMEYISCVKKAGGVPLILGPTNDPSCARRQLQLLDGLIFTGCDDYNPKLYGEASCGEVKLVDVYKEQSDLVLCNEALRLGLPILAICGGMQLVNIALGGTLLVHIERHKGTRHRVRVEKNSTLFKILGKETLRVNSSHHQALDKVGRGLRPVAFAKDGTVEGLEAKGRRFLIGVQWHPERMKTESSFRILSAFIRACRRFKKEAGRGL